jgi:hypothetical protein
MAGGAQLHQYCLVALTSGGKRPAILSHRSNSANLASCSIMSNTGSTPTGHNLQATYGDAHGTNDGCGITEHSNVPAVSDLYASLATRAPNGIPTKTCATYYSEPTKKNQPNLPALQCVGVSGVTTTVTQGSTQIICDDLQVQRNVTLQTASPKSRTPSTMISRNRAGPPTIGRVGWYPISCGVSPPIAVIIMPDCRRLPKG